MKITNYHKTRNIRWKHVLPGIVLGIVTYIIGYLWFLYIGGDRLAFAFGFYPIFADLDQPPTEWQWAGMFFYAHHFVDLVASGEMQGTAVETQDYQLGGKNPLYLLVPIFCLISAGAITTFIHTTEQLRYSMVSGATIVAGYLPLTAVGVFLFKWSETGVRSGKKPSVMMENTQRAL